MKEVTKTMSDPRGKNKVKKDIVEAEGSLTRHEILALFGMANPMKAK